VSVSNGLIGIRSLAITVNLWPSSLSQQTDKDGIQCKASSPIPILKKLSVEALISRKRYFFPLLNFKVKRFPSLEFTGALIPLRR